MNPDEWIELWNTTSESLLLSGWSVEDNFETDLLPAFTLAPSELAIIAGTTTMSLPGGVTLIRLQDGRIGNGLANTSDRLRLKDPVGRVMDEVSWGNAGGCPAPKRGRSLQRASTPCGFEESQTPSPGLPNPVAVTVTPTAALAGSSAFLPWLSKAQ